MVLSYEELFYISKELSSTIDLHSLIIKINDLFNKHIGLATWSVVIKPINTLYLFDNNMFFYLDNYNRDKLDWVEFDDIFYDFNQESDRSILSLINEFSKKLKEHPIKSNLDIKEKIELNDKKLGFIEIYNKNIDLKAYKDLFDTINISILNLVTYKKLVELNKKDSLTGLYNYKEFYKILSDEIKIAEDKDKKFSIVFIDIDNFKHVNDVYGHLTGSKILIEFGKILLQDIRHKDCVTRYGGDEYILLLRDTGKDEAVSVSKRLLRLISENEFTTENGNSINITASMGISTYPGDGKDKNDLIAVADNNMYLAKKGSKNGVKW